MSINILVYAPGVDVQVFDDLSQTLVKGTQTAVAFDGYYGLPEKKSAVFQDLKNILVGVDINHYWGIVNVYLPQSVRDAVLGAVAGKVLDITLTWAKSQRRVRQEKTKVKIRLFGPDNRLLSDDDIQLN